MGGQARYNIVRMNDLLLDCQRGGYMKQSSKKHELGTAALYCRLSRDDNMDSESNSIQNTRNLFPIFQVTVTRSLPKKWTQYSDNP